MLTFALLMRLTGLGKRSSVCLQLGIVDVRSGAASPVVAGKGKPCACAALRSQPGLRHDNGDQLRGSDTRLSYDASRRCSRLMVVKEQ